MKNEELKYVVSGWIILMLFNYYFMNFFFLALELLVLLGFLFIMSLVQLIKLVKEWRTISRQRILKLSVYSMLFFLTFFRHIPNNFIEKTDWLIFYNKRNNIVNQIRSGELDHDKHQNVWVYELPYEFPPVSNGGNDILIDINKEKNTFTVEFWIFRNFFDSPSTKFVYTNDRNRVTEIENKIKVDPGNNWQIEEGWYRTYGE